MAQVVIQVKDGVSILDQRFYNFSEEDLKYLFKVADSFEKSSDVDCENMTLMQQLEMGLNQVKEIQAGKMPKITLKESLNDE